MQPLSPETEETAANAAQPAPTEARVKRLSWPIAVLVAGVALIGAAALAEAILLRNQPWENALLVPDAPLPEQSEGLVPVSVRRLPLELPPAIRLFIDRVRALPDAKEEIDLLHLDKGERTVYLSLPTDTLTPLLASGRLPAPGKPEAIAGDLASGSAFELDGTTFSVVGRLQRGVNSLGYAFVVLEDPALQRYFTMESGATKGWIDPQGFRHLQEDETYLAGESAPEAVGGATRSTWWIVGLTFAGLLLVACGGSVLQVRFLRSLADNAARSMRTVLREIVARPRLIVLVHVVLYGAFFLMMLLAFRYPVANIRATSLVRDAFAKGDLSYIGKAYASGDILRASGATFVQNYLVATILFTILPSLVVPFAGLFKNLASFATMGFVMAPLWTGSAPKLVYHCITMALEMEGYIIASFVVIVWPLRIAKGILGGAFPNEVIQGLRIVASGALLAGIMLAIAALYEATTLIILSPWT